eukprot:12169533-Karenia_brevis.AAC.1
MADPYRAGDGFPPPSAPSRALPEFAFRNPFARVPRGRSLSGGRRLFLLSPRPLGQSHNALSGIFFRVSPVGDPYRAGEIFPLPPRPLGHSQNSLSGIFFRASPVGDPYRAGD